MKNDSLVFPTFYSTDWYNTNFPFSAVKIGDQLIVKFKLASRIPKTYCGKKLIFTVSKIEKVNNYGNMLYNAILSPVDSLGKPIVVSATHKFSEVYDSLYPENRGSLQGWKNRTVKVGFVKGVKISTEKRSQILRFLNRIGGSMWDYCEGMSDQLKIKYEKLLGKTERDTIRELSKCYYTKGSPDPFYRYVRDLQVKYKKLI